MHRVDDFNQLISDHLSLHKLGDLRGLLHSGYLPYLSASRGSPDFEDNSKPKLKDQIIHNTALFCRQVDDVIECTTRSDFGILQADWKRHVDHINELLSQLAAPIDVLNKYQSDPANPKPTDPSSKILALIKLCLMQLSKHAALIIKLTGIFFKTNYWTLQPAKHPSLLVINGLPSSSLDYDGI
ncbi:hypothetical protein PCASD_19302 [Puccinia coronata f. sp. avenae]|uniref:Uncharacterized protein n=1 Tax=Puccinia coronata f. sp. avenae TaxID=200324 RepID=A0A2N5SNS1_9BASI|nr:hypothetical protein PCASD_19302 [Puccinia coronata f. sp. avenae]